MVGSGFPELLVIAMIALLVVGPNKLPDLAKSLGKGLSAFRRAADDVTENVRKTQKPEDLKKEVKDFKASLLYGMENDPQCSPPRGDDGRDSARKDSTSNKAQS